MRALEAADSKARELDDITVETPRDPERGAVLIGFRHGNMTELKQLKRSDAVKLCARLMAHLKDTRKDK
jgi:hypothetical protein